MRGADTMQERLFTMARLEDFVPADHPLRPIQGMVNEALKRLSGLFNEMYADHGRASIAPEKLIRALLLQVLYSVRSERLLVEQLHYNLLFRWFVGLGIDDPVWNHSTFSKNRERLLSINVDEMIGNGPMIENFELTGRRIQNHTSVFLESEADDFLEARSAAFQR